MSALVGFIWQILELIAGVVILAVMAMFAWEFAAHHLRRWRNRTMRR